MRKNNFGFALAEVMIAAGLVGGLAVVVMQLNKSSVQTSSYANASFDINNSLSEIKTWLSKPNVCASTFAGLAINGSAIEIKKTGGAVLFKEGGRYGSAKLVTLKTENIDLPADGPGSFYVVVDFERPKSAGITQTKERKILISATTVANKVDTCMNDSDQAVSNLCTSLGGTFVGTTCSNINGALIANGSITQNKFDPAIVLTVGGTTVSGTTVGGTTVGGTTGDGGTKLYTIAAGCAGTGGVTPNRTCTTMNSSISCYKPGYCFKGDCRGGAPKVTYSKSSNVNCNGTQTGTCNRPTGAQTCTLTAVP